MTKVKKVLLVYPKFPPSFWGFEHALKFIQKKSPMPPLGLLTIAAMFPKEHYQLKLVDMNIASLKDDDINWADLVLTSTMIVQQKSLQEVITRCNCLNTPVVAGGPYPTSSHEEIKGVDHFVLGEAEGNFLQFLKDWENNNAKKIYQSLQRPDITTSPLPRFDLIDFDAYVTMAIQFSRGCPWNCEFCDITKLFGKISRTKTNSQILAELSFLYKLGWRRSVFFVDDNFVGNKYQVTQLLPAVEEWQKERKYPFSFFTEASVNIADSESLMKKMVSAGFDMVFLGIESPNPEALKQANKGQNIKEGVDDYLLRVVRTLQRNGIRVTGGFILGLDGDKSEVFDTFINFIHEAGIPVAMVGLLNVLQGTDLYYRLKQGKRLLAESTGDNTDASLNFIPELGKETLIEGYKRVITTLYDPGLCNYFDCCWIFIKNFKPVRHSSRRVGKAEIIAAICSFVHQLFSRQGPAYLKFLLRVAFYYPGMLPEAISLAIMGYHFQRYTAQVIEVSSLREYAEVKFSTFREDISRLLKETQETRDDRIRKITACAKELLDHINTRAGRVNRSFKGSTQIFLGSFRVMVQSYLNRQVDLGEIILP